MHVTYIIIGITVLISMLAFQQPTLMSRFIMNPHYADRKREYYRFITSGFIHNDHMHLIFNMVSLYFFGVFVELIFQAYFGKMGPLYFVALYVMGIVVSDVPSFFKHRSNPAYNSLGASGGVASVIFAMIIFEPIAEICIYFALCMPGVILGTLYVIFSWYQGKKSNDNINHDAHLYGALFGVVFCFVMYPRSIFIFIEKVSNWIF